MTKISVVIRAKNESQSLPKCLALVRAQTTQPAEIIVVNDHSTDQTVQIAKKFGCKILNLSKDFDYAYACNIGTAKAKGDLIVMLSAHAFLVSNDAFFAAKHHFADKLVAGVFGCHLPDNRASLWEQIEMKYTYFKTDKTRVFSGKNILFGGLMANACSMFRRNLWENYHFSEKLSSMVHGGEDSDWALHHTDLGYKIIFEPSFSVFHCHGDDSISFIKRKLSHLRMYFGAYPKYFRIND